MASLVSCQRERTVHSNSMASASSVWLSVVVKRHHCCSSKDFERCVGKQLWCEVEGWIINFLFFFHLPAWSLLGGKKSVKQKNQFGLALPKFTCCFTSQFFRCSLVPATALASIWYTIIVRAFEESADLYKLK